MMRRPAQLLWPVLLFSCASPSPSEGGGPDLTGVTLTPGSATVGAGDSVSFSATGQLSDGSTSNVSVTWSATGGTVADGMYHAGGSAGSYRVIATSANGQYADTAAVTVTAAVTLTSVTVAPSLDTLVPGASRVFAATGHYSDGSSSGISANWSATGGTITQGGNYTAGGTDGTFRVIASSGGLADTATVVIRTPTVSLVSIAVTPALDTLVVGTLRTFVATGHYSDGSSGSVSVTWSATGGNITTGGAYTAGQTPGNYRVIAAATLAAVADTATVVVKAAPVTLTGVVVTPALDTLAPGGTRTFTATGQYSDGSTGAVTVTWSKTGTTNTITSGGVFTAGATQGAFLVIGRNVAANKADTSTVVIKAPPPTLTAVVVTPASVTLNPGNTQTFAATGQYSDGSSGAVAVTWAASGGTITTGGLYTAGSTTGSYRVIGTNTASGKADTSDVTVSPAGAGTILLQENFDDANAGARGWYANTSPTISTVEKHSGTGSLQMAWQQGATNPVNGASLRHLFTSNDRVYIRYWVKYSTNFVGSGPGQTAHPHEFDLLTDKDDMWIGPSATHMTAIIEHNWATGSGVPRLGVTDVLNIDETKIGVDLTSTTELRAVAGCNGNSDGYNTGCYPVSPTQHFNEKIWLGSQAVFNNSSGSAGYKNNWHKVEVIYQMNSIVGGKGQNDGVVQYWVDGQLQIDLHNVLLRTGANATMKWNQVSLSPYIGIGSPAAQTVWYDDLVIATGPVP